MSCKRVFLALALVALACSQCFSAQTLFSGDEVIPAYSTILFNGKDLSEWVYSSSGEPAGWKVQDGYMEVRGGDLRTKKEFGDCQLHIEFWLPDMGDAKGQARANSGVYMMNAYEVQVLDSYGLVSASGDCGGLYSYAPPMVNACRPPEKWQSFDIFLRAPRFDDQGKKIANAVITVLHNGVLIHSCFELPGATPGGGDEAKVGPIRLQDHGCPVRYRNIWIRSLDGSTK